MKERRLGFKICDAIVVEDFQHSTKAKGDEKYDDLMRQTPPRFICHYDQTPSKQLHLQRLPQKSQPEHSRAKFLLRKNLAVVVTERVRRTTAEEQILPNIRIRNVDAQTAIRTAVAAIDCKTGLW